MPHRFAAKALVAALTALCTLSPAQAELVEVSTPLGNFTMQTREDVAPNTVANFLQYITDGDYQNSIIHRIATSATAGVDIIQGGGFTFTDLDGIGTVPTDPAIANEFNLSNKRGTVAMARLGGLPDSATSQWFINVEDNLALDSIDGGFTVFADVVSGMDVVDAIYNLNLYDATVIHPALSNLPLSDSFQNTALPVESEYITTSLSILHTPEPGSAILLGLGGLALARRRRG